MRLETYEPVSVPSVLHLHRVLYHHGGGRGGHLKSDENLIVSYSQHEALVPERVGTDRRPTMKPATPSVLRR